MDNKILSVNHVSLSFQDNKSDIFHRGKTIEILKDISFDMYENEIIGLVGESGCGKSTLAKTILGLNKGFKGEITHFSQYPQMIFQDPYGSLNPSKTIRFILMEPLKMRHKTTKEEMEKKACSMLERVGLNKEYLDRYPSELSGGQRQRVCMAQALILNPKLLIADEPVSALDVTIQSQVMELLFSLHKEMGLSILFISHDLRIIYQICNRIMIMKEGKIIEEGEIDNVYKSPKDSYTKLLLKNAEIQL